MKKGWSKPFIYVETFELGEHIAASGCKSPTIPNQDIILHCDGDQGGDHHTLAIDNAFSTTMLCTEIINDSDDLQAKWDSWIGNQVGSGAIKNHQPVEKEFIASIFNS